MARHGVLEKYQHGLETLPESGGGGLHHALLGRANLGRIAGISQDQIFVDLRSRVRGTRRVPDREIQQAINTAFRKCAADEPRRRSSRAEFEPLELLRRIIDAAGDISLADIWDSSPISLKTDPREDTIVLLRTLYAEDEALYIGNGRESGPHQQSRVKRVREWAAYFEQGGDTLEFIIPNPLTGRPAPTNDDKQTYRGNRNIAEYRFALLEFDRDPRSPIATPMPLDDQLRFFVGSELPISALIFSGGKSLHAWVRLNNISTAEQWRSVVRVRLFERILVPLGLDRATCNEARLSRLPGHLRTDSTSTPAQNSSRWQCLYWLSSEGRRLR